MVIVAMVTNLTAHRCIPNYKLCCGTKINERTHAMKYTLARKLTLAPRKWQPYVAWVLSAITTRQISMSA